MIPENLNEESEGGLPIRDLFAFAGVRAIIGDPHGKLMQDEVADRIQKMARVLRETVGIRDSLKIMATLPNLSKGEKMTMRVCWKSIDEMLNEAMPDWEKVCQQIHEANV